MFATIEKQKIRHLCRIDTHRTAYTLHIVPMIFLFVIAACDSESKEISATGVTGNSQGGIENTTVGAGGIVTAGSTQGGHSANIGSGGNITVGSGGRTVVKGTGGKATHGGKGGSGGNKSVAGKMASGGKGGSTGASTCGKGGGKYRGRSNQTVTAVNVSRTFVLYESPKLDAKTPAPLVIVPHGYTMSGEAMYNITGYDKIADRDKFVVAYPDGQGVNPWYVGVGVCGAGAAVGATADIDQAFMDEIIRFVDEDQCLDRDHIFLSGFSMGGYFSNETGCMNPAFRAVGPHSGGTHDLSACVNQHKPIILFHFKNDGLISFSCGVDAKDKWVSRNGCSSSDPQVVTVKGGACEYYKNCPADGQVAFCSFNESETGVGELITGHAWSGGKADAFGIPQTESAAELGWAFFKKYAW